MRSGLTFVCSYHVPSGVLGSMIAFASYKEAYDYGDWVTSPPFNADNQVTIYPTDPLLTKGYWQGGTFVAVP